MRNSFGNKAMYLSYILLLIKIHFVASEICARYEFLYGETWIHAGANLYKLRNSHRDETIEVEGTCSDDVITFGDRSFTKFTPETYSQHICSPSRTTSTYSVKAVENVKFADIYSCNLYILSNNNAGDTEGSSLSVFWNNGTCQHKSWSRDSYEVGPESEFCSPEFIGVSHYVPDMSGSIRFYTGSTDQCIVRGHRLSGYNFVYYDAILGVCWALKLDEDTLNIRSRSLFSREIYYVMPLSMEDRCEESTCSSGECVIASEGIKCKCPNGYQYSESERVCQDICLPCMGGNCDKGLEYEEGYRCMTCPDGYEVSDNGLRCEDVDECSQDTIVCHHCVNNVGSYNCSCNAGYVLNEDIKSCINVNECETQDICVNATCEDTPGSYTCNCNDGFKQVEGSSNHCEDIDECSNDPFICEQECTNLVGSFKCSCNDGYALAPNGRNCTDIDECLRDPSPCQQQCNNLEGSFSCSCHAGYAFDKDEITCIEATKSSHVDVTTESTESQEPSLEPDTSDTTKSTACDGDSSPCAHFCKEMNDSFVCSCKEGYALASDGSSCEESGISAGATIGLIAGSLTILGSVVGIMAVYSKKANQALVFDDNSSKI